jgi:hypothetical protein
LKLFNESMITIIQRRQRWDSTLNSRNWCLIHELATGINAFDLIPALTAFVREKRRAATEISSDVREKFRREKDATWINDYYVSIHESLTCWVRSEHDYLNMKKLNEEKVRCKSRWQNKTGNWRRDFVWIQEDVESIDEVDCSAFRGRIIGQLQLIVTIIDSQRVDEHHKSIRYCEAFVNVMKSRNNERFNDIIRMISLEAWSRSHAANLRFLELNRIYDVSSIIRSVHVVPNDKRGLYVNNYANWDVYNSVYADDFMNIESRRAAEYQKRNPEIA